MDPQATAQKQVGSGAQASSQEEKKEEIEIVLIM